RRRHTRSKRDWSSDVCSSDLDGPLSFLVWNISIPGTMNEITNKLITLKIDIFSATGTAILISIIITVLISKHFKFNEAFQLLGRSEERRVGKDCKLWCIRHDI